MLPPNLKGDEILSASRRFFPWRLMRRQLGHRNAKCRTWKGKGFARTEGSVERGLLLRHHKQEGDHPRQKAIGYAKKGPTLLAYAVEAVLKLSFRFRRYCENAARAAKAAWAAEISTKWKRRFRLRRRRGSAIDCPHGPASWQSWHAAIRITQMNGRHT